MAKHTLKILRCEHRKIFKVTPQDFQGMFGHFATLRMKWLISDNCKVMRATVFLANFAQ